MNTAKEFRNKHAEAEKTHYEFGLTRNAGVFNPGVVVSIRTIGATEGSTRKYIIGSGEATDIVVGAIHKALGVNILEIEQAILREANEMQGLREAILSERPKKRQS